MKVDMEYLKACMAYIDAVNKMPLPEIEWVGRKGSMEIAPSIVEEFQYTALSNKNFFEMVILPEYNRGFYGIGDDDETTNDEDAA